MSGFLDEDHDFDFDKKKDKGYKDKGFKDKDYKDKGFKEKDKKKEKLKDKDGKFDKVIKENGKKVDKNGKPIKKKNKNKKELKFDTFIHRVLKQVHPNIGITKQGMTVMNDLVCNAFFQISEEAGKLVKMDNRDTMSARDINCAVRLILPGELAQHSNDEGSSALKHYEQNSKKDLGHGNKGTMD